MGKKERQPLILRDDYPARTLEELQEYFDLDRIMSYYHDGQLLCWLKERYYEDEYQKILELSSELKHNDLEFELCSIFNVSYEKIVCASKKNNKEGQKSEKRIQEKAACKIKEEAESKAQEPTRDQVKNEDSNHVNHKVEPAEATDQNITKIKSKKDSKKIQKAGISNPLKTEKEASTQNQKNSKKDDSLAKIALICTIIAWLFSPQHHFLGILALVGVILAVQSRKVCKTKKAITAIALGSLVVLVSIFRIGESISAKLNTENGTVSILAEDTHAPVQTVADKSGLSSTVKGNVSPVITNQESSQVEMEKQLESTEDIISETIHSAGAITGNKFDTEYKNEVTQSAEINDGFIHEIFDVDTPEGELASMIGTADGEYYMILDTIYGQALIIPNGEQVDISQYDGRSFGNSCLSYNRYKDEIYLLRTTGSDLWIFKLDENGSQELLFRLKDGVGYKMGSSCEYFSDGIMLCGVGGNILIDTNTWTEKGKIQTPNQFSSLKVLNDNLYSVGLGIQQVDFQGNILKDFDVDTSGADSSGAPGHRFFSDGEAIYFGKEDGFYEFDGNEVKPYVLISSFRYASPLRYNFLNITDTGIRYYDWSYKCIQEIRRNGS